MTVRRIVPNLACDDPQALAAFYHALLGLDPVMDHGWIASVAAPAPGPVQLSLAAGGGLGAPLPAVSVEVDDLDAVLAAARRLEAPVVYGPADEPWGVRRFFLRDPAGNLINILSHADRGASR